MTLRSVVVFACLAAGGHAGAYGFGPAPVAQLPTGVVASAGALTLYADHANARLYLVNRTNAGVDVPAQDEDVYAKLEVERGGTWVRAQPHEFSFCGNSYHRITLPPDHFLVVAAHRPAHGSAGKVRYRLYGDLVLVSNAAAGVFDPAELAAASIDALAMQSGDVTTVRAALFGAGIDHDVRRAALRRLEKLPPATAVPVLEQFIATGAPDDNEYSQALRVLHVLVPARLYALVRARLGEPQSPARERMLHEIPFLPRLDDAALIADLTSRVRAPKSPDVPFLLDALASLRNPAIGALLVAVTADPAYPDEVRQRARYLHEEWYGDDLVDLRIRTSGNYGDGHPKPVYLDIEIVNKQKTPLHFDYTAPTDILELYLTREHGREHTFLPVRKGVRFFVPQPANPVTHVDLAPGGKHVMRVAVMDYFDLPAGGGLDVWASVKLPGLQANAQLGGGGIGINPR